jgi:predicted CopG family antitoxin
MENEGCGCKRDDMVDVLMEFGNITKEEAEKKIDKTLEKRDAKRGPKGPSLGV